MVDVKVDVDTMEDERKMLLINWWLQASCSLLCFCCNFQGKISKAACEQQTLHYDAL